MIAAPASPPAYIIFVLGAIILLVVSPDVIRIFLAPLCINCAAMIIEKMLDAQPVFISMAGAFMPSFPATYGPIEVEYFGDVIVSAITKSISCIDRPLSLIALFSASTIK